MYASCCVLKSTPLDIAPILETPLPTVIEDLPEAPTLPQQEALFHLYNVLHRAHQPLLVTASFPLAQWRAFLPDLTTRFSTLPTAFLSPPDDELLLGILLKRFSDLGLSGDEKVLSFLLKHMSRSYPAIQTWVHRLHQATLTSGHSLTIPLVKKLLSSFPKDDG